MGQFLAMSGVIGSDQDQVEAALREYAASKNGDFAEQSLTWDDEGYLVLSEGIGGVTVLYPGEFFDWDDASEFLSRKTGKAVFSLHIHDSDLWMYVLFEHGTVVDQFNPVPDYWGELDEKERSTWKGNASQVAKRVPGLSPDAVSRYLVAWGDEVFESTEQKKAYPDDRYHYGDDWQLVDLMAKLGLDFPIDDHGSPLGTTYRFTCSA